jgi:hypothetical protein
MNWDEMKESNERDEQSIKVKLALLNVSIFVLFIILLKYCSEM